MSTDRNWRRPIVTDAAPPPAGHYSQALVHGDLVWIAGQTPRLPDGTRLDHEDFVVQARQAVRNVDQVARAAGSSIANALQVTVFLTDPEDRFSFDDVWSEFVGEPFPTRAVVQSNLPGFAVEIVAVCSIP